MLYSALRARGEVTFEVVAWDDLSVDWASYDLVLIRTTWDYSENEVTAMRFRAWVRDLDCRGVRVLNHPRVVSWNISKRYLAEVSKVSGVPTIPTVYVPAGSRPDLRRVMAEHGWKDAMIKPCVSANSRNSFRVRGDDEAEVADAQSKLMNLVQYGQVDTPDDMVELPPLRARDMVRHPSSQSILLHHAASDAARQVPADITDAAAEADRAADQAARRALPPVSMPTDGSPAGAHGCDMMIQPYIPSVETHGELSVIILDGQVSHAVQKLPVSGDFRTQEDYGGRFLPVSLTPAEVKAAMAVVRGAIQAVEATELPASPCSPAMAALGHPGSLPPSSLLIARVDFLRVPNHGQSGSHGSKLDITPVLPPTAGNRTPAVSGDQLLLLELEVIEPSLFFKIGGAASAHRLAGAIERLARESANAAAKHR